MNPIYFYSFKHHFPTTCRIITESVSQGESALKKLVDELNLIHGVTDIYNGPLSVQEIQSQIFDFLMRHELSDIKAYQSYLKQHGKIKRQGFYYHLTLSDTSIYLLRVSKFPDQFVHVHPARFSPFTFRVRANTFKTSILSYALAANQNESPFDLKIINEARDQLRLSPIPKNSNVIDMMIRKINFQCRFFDCS